MERPHHNHLRSRSNERQAREWGLSEIKSLPAIGRQKRIEPPILLTPIEIAPIKLHNGQFNLWMYFLQRLRAIQPSKRRSQDRVSPRCMSPAVDQPVDVNALFQFRHNLLDIDTAPGLHGCMQKHSGLDRRNAVAIV